MPDHNQNNAKKGKKVRRRRRPLVLTALIRILQTIGTLLLVIVLTGSMVCCYGAIYIKTVIMPTSEVDMSAYTMDENTIIYYYDDNGDPVELDVLSGDENRERVDYKDVPQDLINAFVAIEDKRFWHHDGVDWYRTAGAVVNMFLSMRNTFGGSTITQQMIKNVTEYDDGTVKRKVWEIFAALELENNYEKEDILTWYLNEIYLGSNCYGVQAASKKYFGKDVSQLTLAECASLAGITNNPSLYGPYAMVETIRYQCKNELCKLYSLSDEEPCEYCGSTEFGEAELWDARRWNKARQETILKAMADPTNPDGAYITEEEMKAALAEELVFARDLDAAELGADAEEADAKAATNIHSWYVETVITEVINDLMDKYGYNESYARNLVYSGGLRIYVPYDPDVQAAVDAIYTDRANLDYTSKTGQLLSSAITIVDNATGYVVAMAGDVGEKTINRGWNNAITYRQPGSSIKPLAVYGPALEFGLITPASISDDNPRSYNGKPWPVNAPLGWRGLTTIQSAVVRSVNTVAVNVLEKVTTQLSYEFLTQRFGITSITQEKVVNGLVMSDTADLGSLSMGGLTNGMSTFEMAAAYATFPRNGAFTEATTYLLVEDVNGRLLINNKPKTEFVIEESTAYYMNTMLTDAVNNGTGRRAKIDGQTVAGKTGTTNDVYDLWFAGYTPYYTAAVWTGYPYNEYIGTGNPSVTLWQQVMTLIHEDLPQGVGFYEPDDLVDVTICLDCGKLADENCTRDLRGNRTQTFKLMKSDKPSSFCSCHVAVTVCTDCPILNSKGEHTGTYLLANEWCPEGCRKEIVLVDYDRRLVNQSVEEIDGVEVGIPVTVQDQYVLLSEYDDLENPYCTVHSEPEPEPEPSDEPVPDDPEAPPTDEPDPGMTEEPGESDQPTETEPPESEPGEDTEEEDDDSGWNWDWGNWFP